MRLELDQSEEIIRKRMKEKSSTLLRPTVSLKIPVLNALSERPSRCDNHPKTGVGPQFVEAELVSTTRSKHTT